MRRALPDLSLPQSSPEAYHLLTGPPAAFADWLRILRPGGRLLVYDGDWIWRAGVAAADQGVTGDKGDISNIAGAC